MKRRSVIEQVLGLAVIVGMLVPACQGIEGNIVSRISGTLSRSPEGCIATLNIGMPVESVVVEYGMPDRPGVHMVEATSTHKLEFEAHIPASDRGKVGFEMASGTEFQRMCALIREIQTSVEGEPISYICDKELQEKSAELSCWQIKK